MNVFCTKEKPIYGRWIKKQERPDITSWTYVIHEGKKLAEIVIEQTQTYICENCGYRLEYVWTVKDSGAGYWQRHDDEEHGTNSTKS